MNREIKFRAWHTKAQKMFSPEEMERDQLTILPGTGRFINVSSTDTRLSQVISNEVMIPLQFTGLLDKHGNEIYEGDIVKYICESGGWKWDMVEPIKWLHGAYRFGNFGLGFNMPGITRNIKHHKYLEIIGNIYENPELLEDK